MEISEELKFEGCNFIRQRLTFSMLSGRAVTINNIRPLDDDPGIKDHEVKLLSIFEKISNGTKIIINRTGTQLKFEPGLIQGGELEVDCGLQRCISYFLEPLVILAPFCKAPLKVTLKGVTNAPNELSVDAIRATWLPVFNKFVLNDELLSIKINARGFLPDGGGLVQREKPGKICKIRGLAYVCKVSPSFASRMIESAKKAMHGYLADVYITVDQRKGLQGGLSPGFGIFLTAETTEGVFYHAAENLLNEIYRGGSLDCSAQLLATTFMTLCEKDVSRFLFGPLSLYTVHGLRHLKTFFEQTFKIDELWKLKELKESKQDPEKKNVLNELRLGSEQKALLTCSGVGYFNINKVML
uniref:RNA 3'-terminal phosphate cyclase-like protein n=1 Tax=Ditylenchus dipsaci TaxID=166011 RepID=A0A915DRN7_9BILA